MDLETLPQFRINEVIKYQNSTATIYGCWWDEKKQWRYGISVARGKLKGEWAVPESELKKYN